MAEKETIIEIDVDLDKAVKATADYRNRVAALKDEVKRLKEEQGENSTETIRAQAELKATTQTMRQNEKQVQNLITAQDDQTGYITRLRKELAVVSKEWAGLTEEELKNTERGKELTKQKLELTDTLKAEEKATGDTTRNVGNYEEGMASAISQTEAFGPAAGAATQAAQQFNGVLSLISKHPIIAAITLIVGLLAGLFKAFTSTQGGADSFNKVMGQVNAIIDVLIGYVAEAATYLVDLFSKDKTENAKGFGETIQEFINDKIDAVLSVVGSLGDAFRKLFDGDFTGAWNSAKDAAGTFVNELTPAGVIVNGMIDGVKAVSTEFGNAAAAAREIADLEVEIRELNIDIVDQQAKSRLELEKQKLLAEDQTKSLQERAEAARRAGEIESQRLQQQLNLEGKRLELLQKELEATPEINRTAEQRLAIAEQSAVLADLEAGSVTKRIELQNKLNAIEKEAQKQRDDAARKEAERAVSNLEYELELYRATNQSILKDKEELNESLVQKERERINREQELTRAALEEKKQRGLINEQEYNLQLLGLQRGYNDQRLELEQELQAQQDERKAIKKEQEKEAAALDFENELALLNQNEFQKLDAERQFLEQRKQQELANAREIGADTLKIQQRYAEAEKEIEQAKVNAKIALAQGFAGNLAQIFGEQTAVGKAAAIAQTTIQTYQSATSAFASLAPIPFVGPVLGAAAAGAAVASGLANVKKILSVKSGLPGDSGTGGASAPSGGGGSYSGASASAPQSTATAPTSTDPTIGGGIVSRDINESSSEAIRQGVGAALQENPMQPTLIEDDVTAAQNDSVERGRTATI